MLQRLLHSFATLIAIIVAYQGYVLVAVPWLEPPLVVRDSPVVTDGERSQAHDAVAKYQRLLASYFPAGHWSLTQPPKVVENPDSTVMLVLDDYHLHDDGRVDIDHCAVLVFPTPRTESPTPPRDAIIVEAPRGAKLQFDEAFRPEKMQIGQITRGEFPGRITIRSDMNEPGPQDDLWVETNDLAMNSKLLFTDSEVRFRLGPNSGSGRELEIRLLESEPSPSGSGGLRIAGVDQLEIREDVRLQAFLGTDSLLPGDDKELSRRVADAGSRPERGNEGLPRRLPAVDQLPVEVRSTGPFRFDFVKYVASFDENVEVWQAHPDGTSDRLSCQQLDVHFARRSDQAAARSPVDHSQSSAGKVRSLEPEKIVAQGNPVVVVSPSRQAEARGSRLQLMLRERRVSIDGGRDVQLVSGPNVLRAPAIDYQHPAADATTKIGSFRADGPGEMSYVPDPSKPEQVFQASWQASVRLSRYNGQPVLTLAGRPKLGMSEMGQLTADQIRVQLREIETDGQTRPIPDRLNAVGQVEVDSPELLARTRELRATFQVEPEDEGLGATTDDRSADRFQFTRNGGARSRVYQVAADEIELAIALRGRRAVPKSLACNYNVAFRELADPYTTHQPLVVSGGQLTAVQLDTDARITIHGAPPNEPPGSQLALIQARGMKLHAAAVELDEGQDRLWSDGPGTAKLVVQRDLNGRPSTSPYPLDLQWQGGLEFNGRDVVFQRNVYVEGAEDRLRCDQMTVTLTAPVEFGKRVDQDAIDMAEIECRGNVAIDHQARDEVGLTSHDRVELARVAINQQTGAIDGDGPGVIRSTHFANQFSAMAGPAATTTSPSRSTRLQFLRVDFDGPLTGNLDTREIAFFDRVRAVYGPVDAWEQELDMSRHQPLPPDTLTLTTDQLRINEDPLYASRAAAESDDTGKSFGPVQLHADGSVRIDGESTGQGKFAATAERASYEQAKELFTLRGSGRAPAAIQFQKQVGGQFLHQKAENIKFHRLTRDIVIDQGHLFEFTPAGDNMTLPPQQAIGPTESRR
jgi:hypothetical protein